MKSIVALLVVALCVAHISAARQPSGPVKNWVVLMMENRAYDHLLGYFQMPGYQLDGLTGKEFNSWDLANSSAPHYRVNSKAQDVSPDPDHSVNGTTWQIFGTPYPTAQDKPLMDGFVMNSRKALGDDVAPRIMECWDADKVPVITSLAKEFVLFDHWYASIPGPTYGNRMYWHAATSQGYCWNRVPEDGFHAKTIYESLDDAGYDWAFYFDQAQDALFFNYTRQAKFADRMRPYAQFAEDAAAGTLPTLSFMLPRFFSTKRVPANDQHPNHAVTLGEGLYKEVYENLRNSPSWLQSAFVLTYDEHGGFYDHVTPPMDVPNPDGLDCTEPVRFDFSRLGLRIPTILISPWVDHSVAHNPEGYTAFPNSVFEHSSFIATLTRMLGLDGPLTLRDAWAAPFDYLFTRTSPRMDTPAKLPDPWAPNVKAYMHAKAKKPEHLQPLHELQIASIRSMNDLLGFPSDHNLDRINTEEEGAEYITQAWSLWKSQVKVEQV